MVLQVSSSYSRYGKMGVFGKDIMRMHLLMSY